MKRFKRAMVTAAAAASIGGVGVALDASPVSALSCSVGWDSDSGAITCPSGVYRRVLVVTTDGGNYYGTCTIINGHNWSSRVVPSGKYVRQAYVAYC